ncbi:MAG: YncE family protein [Egibacteraceae bacterium]
MSDHPTRRLSRPALAAMIAALGLALGAVALVGGERAAPNPVPLNPARPPAAAPDLVRHRLRVVTHPDGAQVTIRSAGGSEQTGQTPFEAMVAGGALDVAVTLDGYNPLAEHVVLDQDRALDLWLDPAGQLHHKLREFTTGSNPKQVAFSPDGGQLWVTLLGGEGVQVFDPSTGEQVAAIDLGEHGAVEVIFSADGSTAYASQMESASVFEIDRGTFTVRRQLPTGGVWSKVMALSPDGATLYVANWSSNDVSEIDLATGRVRRLLDTVGTPRGLYPTPDGRRLFVAGFDGGELARIDLATGASTTLLATGGAFRHLVGDPERGLLYADDMAGDATYVVDLDTEEIRELAATDEKPNTMDITPDGKVLYVSNRGENGRSYYAPGPEWGSVLAIDTASGEVLDAIVGGNQTTGLDVSPDGRWLAFSDFLDNRVQIFALPPYATLVDGDGGRAAAHLADIRK